MRSTGSWKPIPNNIWANLIMDITGYIVISKSAFIDYGLTGRAVDQFTNSS